MSIESFAERLAESSASQTIVGHFWIVPTVQSIHIVAIAFVFTASVVLTLRTFRLVGTEWTVARWGKRLLPGMWASLVVLLLTGIIMIVGEPTRELPNQAFQAKMVAVLVALGLNLWLARRLMRSDGDADGAAKAGALAGVLLWMFIISAGRWIAYV